MPKHWGEAAGALTWSCHVCGEERPDAAIGVFKREHLIEGRVEVTENVRHCIDRADCVFGAQQVHFLPARKEEP
jgi:hypothetical protein